jgi:hypothetical protein
MALVEAAVDIALVRTADPLRRLQHLLLGHAVGHRKNCRSRLRPVGEHLSPKKGACGPATGETPNRKQVLP